jgi:hypothetical protein
MKMHTFKTHDIDIKTADLPFLTFRVCCYELLGSYSTELDVSTRPVNCNEVILCLVVLSQYSYEIAEENHENICNDSGSSGWISHRDLVS